MSTDGKKGTGHNFPLIYSCVSYFLSHYIHNIASITSTFSPQHPPSILPCGLPFRRFSPFSSPPSDRGHDQAEDQAGGGTVKPQEGAGDLEKHPRSDEGPRAGEGGEPSEGGGRDAEGAAGSDEEGAERSGNSERHFLGVKRKEGEGGEGEEQKRGRGGRKGRGRRGKGWGERGGR